jgi:hypothetical protein
VFIPSPIVSMPAATSTYRAGTNTAKEWKPGMILATHHTPGTMNQEIK